MNAPDPIAALAVRVRELEAEKLELLGRLEAAGSAHTVAVHLETLFSQAAGFLRAHRDSLRNLAVRLAPEAGGREIRIYAALIGALCDEMKPLDERPTTRHLRNIMNRIEEIHATADQVSPPDPDRDLAALLTRQFAWSAKTFGEGHRPKALLEHVLRELIEIEGDPADPLEWVDVACLALDGAWRCGPYTGAQVAGLLVQKMQINRERTWPKNVDPDKPTEHVREVPR